MATVSYCAGVPLSGDGKSQPANALIGQFLCMGFGIRNLYVCGSQRLLDIRRIYTSASHIGLKMKRHD